MPETKEVPEGERVMAAIRTLLDDVAALTARVAVLEAHPLAAHDAAARLADGARAHNLPHLERALRRAGTQG